MLKEFEVYYHDLNKGAKQRFDDTFGEPDDFNHGIMPLFIYSVELEDEEDADD